jgi:hypothetical protein
MARKPAQVTLPPLTPDQILAEIKRTFADATEVRIHIDSDREHIEANYGDKSVKSNVVPAERIGQAFNSAKP